ncbi:hypothetical protein BDW68DRAFT_183353 [Aspergillus falconensis]
MASGKNKAPMRVVIIGGSVTGLTLAHCLDKAGIDYVVLEKQQDILPVLGGSIALQPSGCRILDQLGVFDRLEKYRNDLESFDMSLPGFQFRATAPGLFPEGMGYPVTAVKRRELLDTLYMSLEDRSKVKVGARVMSISRGSNPHGPLTVTTKSGAQYTGAVVVGADGTHGITRTEMWRMMASAPGLGTTLEDDQRSMSVSYYAIVGITKPLKQLMQTLRPGRMYTRSYPHHYWMVIPNSDSTVSWFAIIHSSKTFVHPHVPRWSQEEVASKLEELGDYEIREQVVFRDLWQNTPTISSTECQEGLLSIWSFGRIACIGDTVFKLTPNLGIGANLCIESAAALANTLQQLNTNALDAEQTEANVCTALAEYSGTLQARIRKICSFSYRISRSHSLETFTGWLMLRYVSGYLPTQVAYPLNVSIMEGAVTLAYVPRPLRDRRAAAKRARTLRNARMAMLISRRILLGVLALGVSLLIRRMLQTHMIAQRQ